MIVSLFGRFVHPYMNETYFKKRSLSRTKFQASGEVRYSILIAALFHRFAFCENRRP